jgi:pyruvate/2-oxoglutarate dehydrogenase complex dihydrolipoamide dehydrogenase (E3) component
MIENYDLIVIGGGAAGITAARFAARVGVSVALVEKDRIGGDCTWTGCVPSKALLKVAKVAHTVRTAQDYGVVANGGSPHVDMSLVRDYIRRAVEGVVQHETPEHLVGEGIDVIIGAARFKDDHTIQVGERTLRAKKFILTTGAAPFIPNVPGLPDVPYLTYYQLFENECLPGRLLVMGAGPIGSEIAQAYQRLGSQVTLIDIGLLPREEPEVADVLGRVFAREGIRFVRGLVSAARQEAGEIVLDIDGLECRGDVLLVAVGRLPNLAGLELDNADITHSRKGIPVDKYLRTSVKHIYAAGDCIEGNHQFTHFAVWQAFQAVRNALLPLNDNGFRDVVPWTTFTDPEVAHVGLTEVEAREKHGDKVRVALRSMDRVDRAVADNAQEGFIKLVHTQKGKVLGATVVAERAGEVITEYTFAVEKGLKLMDLANLIHVYPTYSFAAMHLAADVATDNVMDSFAGSVLRVLAGGKAS